MTAVSLLDIVTRQDQLAAVNERAARLAGQLIDGLLAERRRICQLESDFAPADWDNVQAATALERSFYALHHEWSAEAEQVLLRIRRLAKDGLKVKDAEAMEDAYASTLSRLKFTPEKTARGMEQARRGQFTSAEELRSELHARLRS